ncbi:hypothetical protein SAMN03159382_04277 [Pseudomonas sp. NFACC23-1]|uniref:hypothetical protein n=1 Tax=unclassified Pseudomonas TaxID=196821 RepID=UPI00088A22F0|nr:MULTISPECIES: hypothetical protein [unclassified Pseudomonas]SDB56017.1 hypothetical protein SAMN03159386_04315 [Pseudomonas sp. NFACC17-2]SEJ77194.1 hypothetical protein SAMN03159382_04277 [Pseudomonas sp. NFACC23-1]SFW88874.1 hypothetical protein SAMN05660640_04856 [Pseudomonas sp. NFACC16-2]
MNILVKIYAALLTFSFQGIEAGWAAENDHRTSRAQHLNVREENCPRSERIGYPSVAMTIGYPLEWDAPETVGHPDVRVHIVEADQNHDLLAIFDSAIPTQEEQGMKIYEDGKVSRYRFTGSDGQDLYVSKLDNIWIGHRKFHTYIVNYKYSITCSDLRGVDDIVLNFLKQTFPITEDK